MDLWGLEMTRQMDAIEWRKEWKRRQREFASEYTRTNISVWSLHQGMMRQSHTAKNHERNRIRPIARGRRMANKSTVGRTETDLIFTTEMSLLVCYVPTVNMLRCHVANRAHVYLAIKRERARVAGHPFSFWRCAHSVSLFFVKCSVTVCARLLTSPQIYKMWIKKCNLDFWLLFFLFRRRLKETKCAYCTIALVVGFVFFSLSLCFLIFFLNLMLKISRNHIAPHHIFLFKYHLVRFVLCLSSNSWQCESQMKSFPIK